MFSRSVLITALLLPAAALAQALVPPKAEDNKPDQKFSADVAYINSFGLQTDADSTVYDNEISLSASYKITDKVTVSASISPYVDLTRQPKDNKRFDFDGGSTFVRVGADIWEEKDYTGILFKGSATYSPPISRDVMFDSKWGNLGGSLSASRKFHEAFSVGYSFGLSWAGYLSPVKTITFRDYGDGASPRPAANSSGGYNGFLSISHGLGVSWTATDKLTIGARFGLSRAQNHGPSQSSDPSNSNNQTASANLAYAYSTGLSASYKLNDSFSFAGSLGNSGPQMSDGQHIWATAPGQGALHFGIPGVFDTRTAGMFFSVDYTLL